ncbi:unnamed protein product, partial [Amoebophrya sp. A25]
VHHGLIDGFLQVFVNVLVQQWTPFYVTATSLYLAMVVYQSVFFFLLFYFFNEGTSWLNDLNTIFRQ